MGSFLDSRLLMIFWRAVSQGILKYSHYFNFNFNFKILLLIPFLFFSFSFFLSHTAQLFKSVVVFLNYLQDVNLTTLMAPVYNTKIATIKFLRIF